MSVIASCYRHPLTALGWEERRQTVMLKLLFSTRILSARIIHL